MLLTVAVINEAQAHRQRRRWQVLAQYVMLQLVRHARMVWMAITEQASMLPTREDGSPDIEQGAAAVRDTTCLRTAAADLVSASDQRRRLRDTIADLAEHSDEVLGRWADVMLNADAYAEVIDRHVELASSIAWLEGALDNFDPPEDARRWQRSQANPGDPAHEQRRGRDRREAGGDHSARRAAGPPDAGSGGAAGTARMVDGAPVAAHPGAGDQPSNIRPS